MIRSLGEIEDLARAALMRRISGSVADFSAQACAFLEGVGYPGLRLLAEALADEKQSASLEKDALGLDLQGVSCVFIDSQVAALTRQHGRLFLRNVRHGLYLLPDSVAGNYSIGCPVDPGFALGGERGKNPYTEKLEAAKRDGVDVDSTLWSSLY